MRPADVGGNILQKGTWAVPRFGATGFSHPIDWQMDPFQNRSWVWLLHQLSFIQNLVTFDRQEKGIEGGVWAMQAIRSWWCLHSNPETAPPHAWHDHGSAKRVENLVLLRKHLRAQLGKDERITHSDLRLLRTMFETHARFLADGSKYSKGTNHGLEQSLALFILSCDSSHETWANEFRTIALKRIRHEVSAAFSDDGGHNENSPQYQKYGVWQLLKIEKLFKQYQKYIPREETSLTTILNKSTFALSYMIAPNGIYPPTGDTEAISYKDIFPGHDYPETHPAYLFSISKGRDGTPPADPDLILPQSGWAALRSGWKDENDVHLLTKCAFNSHYHRHDDDTSFVLHAHGEEWITDGGLYKYEEKDPMRIHLRSHYAHSLSAPDGVEPIRNVKLHGGRNKIEDFHSGEESSWVEMTSHMFPGYVSRRRIALERATSKISVTDRLTPLDDTAASLSCTTRFLVPKNKSVTIEGSNVRIEGAGHSLLICPDREANNIVVSCGQTEPELRGWQSRTFNTTDPAHSIEFHYTGRELNVTHHLIFSHLQ